MNYAALFSKFIDPVYHRLKHDGVLEARRHIESFMAASPAGREAAQMDKLDRLLQHAYANCAFYRQRFDRAGFDLKKPTDAFQQIPTLTKSDIRRNMSSIRSPDDSPFAPVHRNSTGGSTGEKLDFYYDGRCNAMRTATASFIMEQMGLCDGARVARLWGAQMDLSAMSSVRERLHSFVTRTLMLSTYELSDERMAAYADSISSFKPDLLVSYPSPLVTFCEYLTKTNRPLPPIRHIVTSAEQLFDWQREIIEKTFGSKVLNRYGSREFAGIAHEFPGVQGLQVLSFRLLVEILDDQNQPVGPGERGHIHVTDLDNYGMPFIRYRIEDAGVWRHAGHVGSPSGLPIIETVDGRSFDVIQGTNGNRLGGTYWTILFRSHPGVKQFQVRQTREDHLVIAVVPDDDLNGTLPDSTLRYFTDRIHEQCGADMTIDMHPVAAIERSATGKNRLVISDLK